MPHISEWQQPCGVGKLQLALFFQAYVNLRNDVLSSARRLLFAVTRLSEYTETPRYWTLRETLEVKVSDQTVPLTRLARTLSAICSPAAVSLLVLWSLKTASLHLLAQTTWQAEDPTRWQESLSPCYFYRNRFRASALGPQWAQPRWPLCWVDPGEPTRTAVGLGLTLAEHSKYSLCQTGGEMHAEISVQLLFTGFITQRAPADRREEYELVLSNLLNVLNIPICMCDT